MEAQATSVHCRPGSEVVRISDAVEIQHAEISPGENRYQLSIPTSLNSYSLDIAEVVVGTLEEPVLVFPIKLTLEGQSYQSTFTAYKSLGPIHINLAYGGSCNGTTVWQQIDT
jgi:hypothetical protein